MRRRSVYSVYKDKRLHSARSPTGRVRKGAVGLVINRNSNRKTRALGRRFPRHGGIYRSDVSLLLLSSGQGAASRWSGPAQAIGRDGRSTSCPSSAMSSGRLFLDRVARQQSPSPLHRQPDHKTVDRTEGRNYHRMATASFAPCLTEGVHPIICVDLRSSVAHKNL